MRCAEYFAEITASHTGRRSIIVSPQVADESTASELSPPMKIYKATLFLRVVAFSTGFVL